MKLSQLLKGRDALLRQATMANLAFAYQTLSQCGDRIVRAGLSGRANLKPADPQEERYWGTLIALESSQSVIEEHFTEEELTDFADAVAFVTGREDFDLVFSFEDFSDQFLAPLRAALEQAGIEVDSPSLPVQERTPNESA